MRQNNLLTGVYNPGGVQEAFLKTQKHSISETVRIVMSAVDHLDLWMKTWEDWARKDFPSPRLEAPIDTLQLIQDVRKTKRRRT